MVEVLQCNCERGSRKFVNDIFINADYNPSSSQLQRVNPLLGILQILTERYNIKQRSVLSFYLVWTNGQFDHSR